MKYLFPIVGLGCLLIAMLASSANAQEQLNELNNPVIGDWLVASATPDVKSPYATLGPGVYSTIEQATIGLLTDKTGWFEPERSIVRFQDEGGGDAGGGADPSDPTQISPHLVTEYEWTKLADGDGDTILLKLSPWIPLTKSSLFTIDVPIPTYSGTDILGNNTGIGDIRMRYFYLFKTQSDLITAVAPSLDVIAPTGDVDKGLGGGSWLIMPNLVTVISPAKNWSNYLFMRYVHSEGAVRGRTSNGGPGFPSDGLLDSETLRGMSLECSSVFQLQDACFDYAMFTPDYFQNFTGSRSSTLQFKYELGKKVNDKIWVLFEAWHPVGGEVGNDFTVKIKTDLYF